MRTLVFQGDSITDCDRFFLPEKKGLGDGYVSMIAEELERRKEEVRIYNKGISGDKASSLLARWEEDCLAWKPDILTILVGINDVWEQMDSMLVITIEQFTAQYESLLRQAREQTNARIILMEPYVLPYPEERIRWRRLLDPEIHAIRRLAAQYQTEYIPLDGLINQAAIRHGYHSIATDGAHLTQMGHELVKQEWLKVYDRLVHKEV